MQNERNEAHAIHLQCLGNSIIVKELATWP
jgi:hypothetical protein